MNEASSSYAPPTTRVSEATCGYPLPWLASLLSLVFPGTGQVYAGRRLRGAGCLLGDLLIRSMLVSIPVYDVSTELLIWSGGSYLVLVLALVVDAWRVAVRAEPFQSARRRRVMEITAAVAASGLISLLVWLAPLPRSEAEVQSFTVLTTSMAPSLLPGDRVFARVMTSDPVRGSIVAFRKRDFFRALDVKRVIGLPGERVEVRGDEIRINEVRLERTYFGATSLSGKDLAIFLERSFDGADYVVALEPDDDVASEASRDRTWIVPDGSYFVLGDLRNDSIDSRHWWSSYVERDSILGTVTYIHSSVDPETGNARADRIGWLDEQALPDVGTNQSTAP